MAPLLYEYASLPSSSLLQYTVYPLPMFVSSPESDSRVSANAAISTLCLFSSLIIRAHLLSGLSDAGISSRVRSFHVATIRLPLILISIIWPQNQGDHIRCGFLTMMIVKWSIFRPSFSRLLPDWVRQDSPFHSQTSSNHSPCAALRAEHWLKATSSILCLSLYFRIVTVRLEAIVRDVKNRS